MRDAGSDGRYRVAIDPDIRDLIPDYMESLRVYLVESRKALDAGDFGALRANGHQLRGSGRAYGFERISEIGVALETAAAGANAEAAAALLVAFADYMERLDIVYATDPMPGAP